MNISKLCKTYACKRGFTLVELIIVISLIAVISGAVLTGTRAAERRVLQNASLAVQADIRRIQRLAVIEGRRYRMAIPQIPAAGYHIYNPPRNLAIPTETVELPPGITIVGFTVPNQRHFDFLPRGTISSGFTIVLRSGNYVQELTATVTGGRIEIFPIERLN